MAVSGDVTVAQDGGHGNVKLHPYLVTLVRWCVSCLWSTATVLLHRLMITPLQPITGPKPVATRPKIPKRVAGTEHLHPEPKVECQLLHQPENHTMDVIFVHGLYGSLGNTWRQGDWRQKYLTDPKIVTLRDHSKRNPCNCHENSFNNLSNNENKCFDNNITDLNEPDLSIKKINEKLSKKIIPQENELITEQFYNNTLMDQEDANNYKTQANFVCDMFRKETNCDRRFEKDTFKFNEDNNVSKCDQNSDNNFKCKYSHSDSSHYTDDNGFKCDQNSRNDFKCNYNEDDIYNYNVDNSFKCKEDSDNHFKCDQISDNNSNCEQNGEEDEKFKYNEINDFNECKCNVDEKSCEVGCGCICNECYSTCWPRDWVREDFPGARVISVNYTSDPYLWRPLWIKENKRLNLFQRAEQMMEQLLDMGVGEKPIIWVGHSKGGLFIKQIYCEAYEAYKKINKNATTNVETEQKISKNTEETRKEINNGITAENIDTIIGHFSHTREQNDNHVITNDYYPISNDNCTRTYDNTTRTKYNLTKTNDNSTRTNDNHSRSIDNVANNNACIMNETVQYENVFEQTSANNYKDNLENIRVVTENICNLRKENSMEANRKKLQDVDLENGGENQVLTSSNEVSPWSCRAALWSSTRGFMFYSVPHRGSPLAHIKTPVTARSVDLLEIAKDCPLVLELQSRWEHATRGAPVSVRSVVETTRTLMSVLWLRIVSTDSADAGIGTLSGIAVDHREICKPSSRSCRLYTMLTDLIRDAMACKCHSNSAVESNDLRLADR